VAFTKYQKALMVLGIDPDDCDDAINIHQSIQDIADSIVPNNIDTSSDGKGEDVTNEYYFDEDMSIAASGRYFSPSPDLPSVDDGKTNEPVKVKPEIEWDKCTSCGQQMKFKNLGYYCEIHGPKKEE